MLIDAADTTTVYNKTGQRNKMDLSVHLEQAVGNYIFRNWDILVLKNLGVPVETAISDGLYGTICGQMSRDCREDIC